MNGNSQPVSWQNAMTHRQRKLERQHSVLGHRLATNLALGSAWRSLLGQHRGPADNRSATGLPRWSSARNCQDIKRGREVGSLTGSILIYSKPFRYSYIDCLWGYALYIVGERCMLHVEEWTANHLGGHRVWSSLDARRAKTAPTVVRTCQCPPARGPRRDERCDRRRDTAGNGHMTDDSQTTPQPDAADEEQNGRLVTERAQECITQDR